MPNLMTGINFYPTTCAIIEISLVVCLKVFPLSTATVQTINLLLSHLAVYVHKVWYTKHDDHHHRVLCTIKKY